MRSFARRFKVARAYQYIIAECVGVSASGKAIKVRTTAGEGFIPVACVAADSQVRAPGDRGLLRFDPWLLKQTGKEFLIVERKLGIE
jgi:hypothetical protein